MRGRHHLRERRSVRLERPITGHKQGICSMRRRFHKWSPPGSGVSFVTLGSRRITLATTSASNVSICSSFRPCRAKMRGRLRRPAEWVSTNRALHLLSRGKDAVRGDCPSRMLVVPSPHGMGLPRDRCGSPPAPCTLAPEHFRPGQITSTSSESLYVSMPS